MKKLSTLLAITAVFLAAAALSVVWLVNGAVAAQEGTPSYPAGDTVSVAGTAVSCSVAASSVTCTKRGGFSVTLDAKGRVRVTRSRLTVPGHGAGAGKHHVLGPNAGFTAARHVIYCHVYVRGVRMLDCYKLAKLGADGAEGSYGFDISNLCIGVYRFGKAGVRHPVKTVVQPAGTKTRWARS